jgi:RNA recognition motif-containing protein
MSNDRDNRVWVGHLAEEVGERDVRELFEHYGEVVEIKFIRKSRDDIYAFIQFDSRDAANDAIAKADQTDLCGQRIKVGPANAPRKEREESNNSKKGSYYDEQPKRSRSPKRSTTVGKYRLRLSNLPADMSWQELKRLGGDYGKSVVFARTQKDRDGGMTGVLEFTERRDADRVTEALDGKRMEGAERRIRVDYDAEDDVIKRHRSRSPVERRRRY